MRHASSTIHVDVAPAEAFDLFADVKQIPEWYFPKVEVADVTGRLDAEGAGYTVISSFGGRSELHWKATRVERPHLIEARCAGDMAATMVARFEPVSGGTDVTLEGDYEASLGLEVEQSLKDFKALVEAEAFVYP